MSCCGGSWKQQRLQSASCWHRRSRCCVRRAPCASSTSCTRTPCSRRRRCTPDAAMQQPRMALLCRELHRLLSSRTQSNRLCATAWYIALGLPASAARLLHIWTGGVPWTAGAAGGRPLWRAGSGLQPLPGGAAGWRRRRRDALSQHAGRRCRAACATGGGAPVLQRRSLLRPRVPQAAGGTAGAEPALPLAGAAAGCAQVRDSQPACVRQPSSSTTGDSTNGAKGHECLQACSRHCREHTQCGCSSVTALSATCCLCRWLRQTLQTAAKADTSHLLDINVHLTKALSRSDSYASLSKVRRCGMLQKKCHGRDTKWCDTDQRIHEAPGNVVALPA